MKSVSKPLILEYNFLQLAHMRLMFSGFKTVVPECCRLAQNFSAERKIYTHPTDKKSCTICTFEYSRRLFKKIVY